MNFKGHLYGGIVAGSAVTLMSFTALPYDYSSITTEALMQFNSESQKAIIEPILLFGITLVMALFSDLDITSIPQRWFYRGVFLLLLLLWSIQEMGLFVMVSLASFLPIMHQHRGWTHWKIAPWLVSLFGILVFLSFSDPTLIEDAEFQEIGELFLKHFWIYSLACVAGHYTHLFLDQKNQPKKRR